MLNVIFSVLTRNFLDWLRDKESYGDVLIIGLAACNWQRDGIYGTMRYSRLWEEASSERMLCTASVVFIVPH